ncbi:MAG: hypothetical protein U0176_02220 [Bacteroidia bacterium]
MRFLIKTAVKGEPRKVFAGFDHNLLLKLSPPGMRIDLIHADPAEKPDGYIHLKVTMLGIIRQEWKNRFSNYEINDDRCHFVDQGDMMPFPIKLWRHDHRVERLEGTTHIIDDVQYGTNFFLLDWLLFPVLWFQFRYRRPIYRRHFGQP